MTAKIDYSNAPPPPRDPWQWPPTGSLLAKLNMFIYHQSPRPLPEVSVAASIAFLSGITGGYQTPGLMTGLNTYTMVTAKTGFGKEAGASGIDRLFAAVEETMPAVDKFIGPQSFASEPGLHRHLAERSKSFVGTIREGGKWLRRVSNERASQHHKDVADALIKLYSVSSYNFKYRGIAYSDATKNLATISGPNVSIYSESTPDILFETMTEDLVLDGLFPRFTIIEYQGRRPRFNERVKTRPDDDLVARITEICMSSQALLDQNKFIQVQADDDATKLLKDYNERADVFINNAHSEAERALWARSHLKAIKLASLLAVGENHAHPMINGKLALWATEFEFNATKHIVDKFDRGETGNQSKDDHAQLNKLREVIRDWYTKNWFDLQKYKAGSHRMHSQRYIPYAYVQRRLINVAAFKNAPGGATAALKRTINSMIYAGELVIIDPRNYPDGVDYSGVIYRLAGENDVIKEWQVPTQPRV